MPRLIEALKDENMNVRIWASAALRNMGSAATAAKQALREARKDPSEVVRKQAAQALAKLSEARN